jgi:hypothetical protein
MSQDVAFNFDGWDVSPFPDAPTGRFRQGCLAQVKFVPETPSLPGPLSGTHALHDYFDDALTRQGAALLDFEIVAVDGRPSLRTVTKLRGFGYGYAFVGSVQIHFATCWYHLHLQTMETGTTGIREAAVLLLSPQSPTDNKKATVLTSVDELPSLKTVKKLASDELSWDSRFPDHPLSVLRAAQSELILKATLSQQAKVAPLFGER